MTVPIDYGRSKPPDPGARQPSAWLFFLGLIVGTGISTLIWWFGWNQLEKNPHSGWVVLGVPATKLIVGVGCIIASPKLREFGVGLIASIAVGILIFGWSFMSHLCGH